MRALPWLERSRRQARATSGAGSALRRASLAVSKSSRSAKRSSQLPAAPSRPPPPPVAGPELGEVDDTAGVLAEFVKRDTEKGIDREGAQAHLDTVLAAGVSSKGRAIADPARKRRDHLNGSGAGRQASATGLLGDGERVAEAEHQHRAAGGSLQALHGGVSFLPVAGVAGDPRPEPRSRFRLDPLLDAV